MTAEERAEIARVAALVVERVRESLARPSPGMETQAPAEPAGPRVLAIFTGGGLGLDAALEQLAQLRAEGWRTDALLSPDARQGIGCDRLQAATGGREVPAPALAGPFGVLASYQAVLVPVLTRSNAARLAVGIVDTDATEAIWQALMLGKPVVAARNACDPGADCLAVAMKNGSEPLRRLLAGHMERLAEFGILLVDAGGLAAAAREAVGGETTAAGSVLPRAIITGEDVRQAADAGQRQILAGADSQVTDVARDLAQRLGVRIRLE